MRKFMAEIAGRRRGGEAGHDHGQGQDVRTQRIDDDETVECPDRTRRERDRSEREADEHGDADGGEGEPASLRPRQDPAQAPGQGWCSEKDRDAELHHPRRFRSSSVESEPNVTSIRRA